jgi:NAD(P)H-dependent flavin oxidoreductase YrpB (nitropropane dioxygenase family)
VTRSILLRLRAVEKDQDMSAIATRFTARFGCRHPFACAGMAFAGMTELARAVCRGGGVGAIGVGLTPAEQLRGMIHELRKETAAPFNINFLTIFDNDAHVRVCAEERVPIVSFHWGHPSAEHIKLLRDTDVSVWEQIGSVEAAKRAAGDGIEAVVAQGSEAGGHNYGSLPTLALVPMVVDAVAPSLVLAAGGIADGRGVAAALALGADAVWVGSRMVATRESAVHPEHKRRLVAATGEQTVLSGIFGPEMPHFNPMRVIRNRVVEQWNDRLKEVPTRRDDLAEIGRTNLFGQDLPLRKFNAILATEDTEADWEEMPWLGGQGIGLIHDIPSASDAIDRMMTEAQAVLGRLAGAIQR